MLEKLTTHKQMTADEIAKSLGFSILLVRPCVCDLHINKVIRKSGLKRANASGIKANVWELAA